MHLRPKASDSGSFLVGYFTTSGQRLTEMRTHAALLDPDMMSIVAGDFNEGAEESAVRHLSDRGMSSVVPMFGGSPTWRYAAGVVDLQAELDHVVIDGSLEATQGRVLESGASDHLPVMVVLKKQSPARDG